MPPPFAQGLDKQAGRQPGSSASRCALSHVTSHRSVESGRHTKIPVNTPRPRTVGTGKPRPVDPAARPWPTDARQWPPNGNPSPGCSWRWVVCRRPVPKGNQEGIQPTQIGKSLEFKLDGCELCVNEQKLHNNVGDALNKATSRPIWVWLCALPSGVPLARRAYFHVTIPRSRRDP